MRVLSVFIKSMAVQLKTKSVIEITVCKNMYASGKMLMEANELNVI